MRDQIKTAIRMTAKALQAELDAGKYKGHETEVMAALKAAKDAVGTSRPHGS